MATKKTARRTSKKTPAPAAPAEPTPSPAEVDINSLSPEQLARLQKQLAERRTANKSKLNERYEIIDAMLQEKDDDGNFVYTTRDIVLRLAQNNLCEFLSPEDIDTEKEEREKEIRKIQSRKQRLEKLTDKKGELVHKPGTFGYKKSEHVGGGGSGSGIGSKSVKKATIVTFFTSGRASELSDEDRQVIIAALA